MHSQKTPASCDGKKKILVVEDDKDLNKFISYLLKKAGFDICTAYDGEEGLDLARQEKPDLIVLDLKLPKFQGEDVCKTIREDHDKHFARTPIVMLTGKSSDVDRVIGNVIGASCYLTKPFGTNELLKEVRKFA